MPHLAPGEVEVSAYFRIHTGGRFQSAGLHVQFHYNQIPGIHFKVSPPEEYRDAIVKGIQDGLAIRFPDFPNTASIWILAVTIDDVESSQYAFYRVGRMVIDQAFSLVEHRTGH